MGKVKNEKGADKDELTAEMVKGGGDMVVDWIWILCNTAFESGVVPEDWTSTVIVPLCKGKGERTKCMNYRDISLLSIHIGEFFFFCSYKSAYYGQGGF